MNLPDEELDALAERLWKVFIASPANRIWEPVAREAARWAEERQGEVVWETTDDVGNWYPSKLTHIERAEAAGHPIRAIRVIATTTKGVGHE